MAKVAVVLVGGTLGVTALGLALPRPTPGPIPQAPSSWNDIAAQIDEDGQVSVEVALQAYSLLVEPLPGVAVAEPAIGDMTSASPAIRWILGYWDQISGAQRAAVQRRLFDMLPPPSTSSGIMFAGIGPFAQQPGTNWQAIVDKVAQILASADYLARPLTMPALVIDQRFADSDFPEPDFRGAGAYPAQPSDGAWRNVEPDAPSWTCVIRLSGPEASFSHQELVSLAAHELFHCYQYETMGLSNLGSAPSWIYEGSAAWVQYAYLPAQEYPDRWATYFQDEFPLQVRSYDAIGFYAHLDELHGNLWGEILNIIDDPHTAFAEALELGGARFVDTWATSLLREPSFGPAWDMAAPHGFARNFLTRSVSSTNALDESIDPANQRLFHVSIDPEVAWIEVSVDAHGGMLLLGPPGPDTVFFEGAYQGFIPGPAASRLACPQQSPGPSPGPRRVRALIVAMTGTSDPGTVSIRAVEDEHACPTPTPEPTAVVPEDCLRLRPYFERLTGYRMPHVRRLPNPAWCQYFSGELSDYISALGRASIAANFFSNPGPCTSDSKVEGLEVRPLGEAFAIYLTLDEPLLVGMMVTARGACIGAYSIDLAGQRRPSDWLTLVRSLSVALE